MKHISEYTNLTDSPKSVQNINASTQGENSNSTKKNGRQNATRSRPTKKRDAPHPFSYKDTHKNFLKFLKATKVLNEEARYRLAASHQRSFSLIIALYNQQLQKKMLYNGYKLGDPLPFFETYNCSLAETLTCAENTVRNHRRRFLDTGVVVVDNLGTGSVRIMLNPLFFRSDLTEADVYKYVKSLKMCREKESENPALEALNGMYPSTFAPIVVSKSSTSVKESNSMLASKRHVCDIEDAPEGCDNEQPAAGITKNKVKLAQGSLDPQEAGPQSSPMKEKNLAGGGGQNPEKRAAQLLLVMKLVEEFWQYAAMRLYHGLELSDKRKKFILNCIFKYHFNCNRLEKSDEYWLGVFEHYIHQVDTAVNWLRTKPHIKLPAPEYYFQGPAPVESERKKEFKFYKSRNLYVNRIGYLTLNKIKKEVLQFKRGKGRYRDKSLMGLYQLHHKRINEINIPKITEEFKKLATTLYQKR